MEVVNGICNCLRTDNWKGSQTVVARFIFGVNRHGAKSTVLKQVAETNAQVPPEEFFRHNPCEVPRTQRVREVWMDEQTRKKVVVDMLENESGSVNLKEVWNCGGCKRKKEEKPLRKWSDKRRWYTGISLFVRESSSGSEREEGSIYGGGQLI